MKRKRKRIVPHSTQSAGSRFDGSVPDSEPGTEVFRMFEMEITWDAMPEPEVKRLPRSVKSRMNYLMPRIHTEAAGIVAEMRELVRQYPKVLCLRNWLCHCLRAL